jgi:hypothetical protein
MSENAKTGVGAPVPIKNVSIPARILAHVPTSPQEGCSDADLAEAHALRMGFLSLGLTCDECGGRIEWEDDGDVEWTDEVPAVLVHWDCSRDERDLGHHLTYFLGASGLAALRDPLYVELAGLIPRLHPGARAAS